jgi:FAD/FMN-containing dehydrogenase
MPPVERLIAELAHRLGPGGVLTDPDVLAGYTVDWTGRWRGHTPAVVRPRSTPEVAAVLQTCRAAGVGVVPQGGNTGLVGGSVPRSGELVCSLRRLDHLAPVDAETGELVVGAGVTLEAAQEAARAAGWDVGVDLGSRGSATIGGMLATNAGGEHVLAHGSMRDQVIGAEAVLADGTVVGRVPALRKDNTGYRWDGILAGSEGTLAVITAVHLRLVRLLPQRAVALAGCDDLEATVRLAGRLRRDVTGLVALEAFFAAGCALVCDHFGLPWPLPERTEVLLLAEAAAAADEPDPAERLAAALAGAREVRAGVLASDDASRRRLWRYREGHTEAINARGVPHKLDVALPPARLPAFAAEVRSAVQARRPGAEVFLFGHVGDGNLHVNVVGPDPDDDAVDRAVLELVARRGGSISAEHGIGVAKVGALELVRRPGELAAMRAVKAALDPTGILNPGVLVG